MRNLSGYRVDSGEDRAGMQGDSHVRVGGQAHRAPVDGADRGRQRQGKIGRFFRAGKNGIEAIATGTDLQWRGRDVAQRRRHQPQESGEKLRKILLGSRLNPFRSANNIDLIVRRAPGGEAGLAAVL